MHYLGNNHVGFDPLSLGFPSILGCQAVVYHVEDGLFGWHDMKSGKGISTQEQINRVKAEAFEEWIGTQASSQSPGLAIYGVINQTHQYTTTAEGVQDWEDMLTGLAEVLDFDGPVYGARVTSHVGKKDSLYVQFDVVGQGCQIGYKRWSKMELDKSSPDSPDDQAVIQRIGAYSADFRVQGLAGYEYDDAYPVQRINQNKGFNLNIVSAKKITQFA